MHSLWISLLALALMVCPVSSTIAGDGSWDADKGGIDRDLDNDGSWDYPWGIDRGTDNDRSWDYKSISKDPDPARATCLSQVSVIPVVTGDLTLKIRWFSLPVS